MLSNKIKNLRTEHGMSQSEFAKVLDVSTVSIGAWENGTKSPSLKYLVAIANAFCVSIDELLDLESRYTSREETLVRKFRQLNTHGKEAVELICDYELKSSTTTQPVIHRIRRPEGGKLIRVFNSPAAAGIAAPLPGDEFDEILMHDVPQGTDFAVRIQGNSMSPKILDGDIVFVKRTESLEDDEIGIFCVDGSTYCKQIKRSSTGITLWSINRDMAHADVRINRTGDSCLSTIGKVIGVSHLSS